MASGSVVVERSATSMLKPASATKPHCMFLSAFDINFRWFHYLLTLFFYKLEGGPNAYEEAVERLKVSLSKVLVAYYPWAGRLVEPTDGRLALQCNDAGVEFVEASVDLPFSSLEEDDFQHKDFFRNFCTLVDIVEWTGHDLPLLSIQVTRFQGGEALALGISSCHVVADGNSTYNFLKSWGECARDLEMSLPPVHMREELCLEKLIRPLENKQSLSLDERRGFCITWPEPNVLTQHNFHFDSQTLMKLKHIASGDKPCSTFQALVAHIWKHVGLAKGLKDSSHIGVGIIGDFRRILNPPLPHAYFGNVVMRHHAKAKMGDLQRESLRDSVKRIQEVIESFDDRHFRSFGGALELLPLSEVLQGHEHGIPFLNISGSPKFPIYDVEFGWGKVSCVQSPHIRGDGEAFMWMGKDQDGSIGVALALDVPSMERLKLDRNFLFV